MNRLTKESTKDNPKLSDEQRGIIAKSHALEPRQQLRYWRDWAADRPLSFEQSTKLSERDDPAPSPPGSALLRQFVRQQLGLFQV
jgi:hypothetical protein